MRRMRQLFCGFGNKNGWRLNAGSVPSRNARRPEFKDMGRLRASFEAASPVTLIVLDYREKACADGILLCFVTRCLQAN